ncbi:MAG TPA: hypothetical protein DDX39_07800 [Bacteroidales bacterium]|nr:MAG: hypothetical protein A2W98_14315 [Bacteroidetes bacterium GWF2_33_38]OFY74904.1 MAG: hypothetical protein A2265_10255 [Bacteroidetes bacterium RIFOXYA12_FULL_33_9]OFY90447.1 MAG: hypothetical protein A2236_11035 [Bacteroidetes bacterium RIFOXYA2_FULL_33_7]HBF88529.1 hypothetical protein [Bacteroidales bacterium]
MSFFAGRKLVFSLHIVAWIILFILPSYFLYIDSSNDDKFLVRSFYQTGIFILIFYINYFWLIPYFFFKKRKSLYFLFASVLIVIMSFVYEKFDNNPMRENKMMPPPEFIMKMNQDIKKHPRPSKNWPTYNFILTSVLISSFGFGLRFSEKLFKNEKKQKEIEKAKINSELAFLKNQINPHFFFNTLNNIYSLIQFDTENAQKAVLQLSKLMRYVLHKSENDNVTLSQDIEFMQNYIELMKLRLSNKVELNINFPSKFCEIQFPPLLFVPFIENAFKYGVSYREDSKIKIEMDVTKDDISFLCINTIFKNEDSHISSMGIGLENVSKRLQLLFPTNHTLVISDKNNIFEVYLTVQFTNEKNNT